MKKIAILLFLLGIHSLWARPIQRDQGIYGGVFGAASYTYDSQSDANDGSKFNRFGNGAVGNLGYQFNQYLATEIDYGYYHPTTNTTTVSKIYQPAVALKGIAPLVDNLSLYGKLGVAENQYHYTDGSRSNYTQTRPLVGLGAAYSLSKTFEVGFIVQSTVGRDDSSNGQKAWDGLGLIGAGVNLYF